MQNEKADMSKNNGKYNVYKWKAYLKEAKDRIENKDDKTYSAYRADFNDYMKDYADKNAESLKTAYMHYKTAISAAFFDGHYELLAESRLKYVLKDCKIMVVTANPIEKAVLHFSVIQNSREKSGGIKRIICGTNAYFVFRWGKYKIAHIHQPQTGSFKDLGLNTIVNEALKYFTPNIILSLGVAFGIDYRSQNIGDVIVSRKIFPYSENKRDEEIIRPDRTQDKVIDNWLDVRLVNVNGFLDEVTYGGILSGGSVMSSFKEKDKVCTAYSANDYVVGGEMEGSALFQISYSSGIPCAVIKGICDWGIAKNDIFPNDKNKDEEFKDSLQAYAMEKVVEKCERLFWDKTIFNTSKGKDIGKEKKKNHLLTGLSIVSNMLCIVGFILICFERFGIKNSLLVSCLLFGLIPLMNLAFWIAFTVKRYLLERWIDV